MGLAIALIDPAIALIDPAIALIGPAIAPIGCLIAEPPGIRVFFMCTNVSVGHTCSTHVGQREFFDFLCVPT
jgi:hypothetical protein